MSHASATLPLLPLPRLPSLLGAARITGRILAACAQAAGFAALLWLLAAGPGLLSDQASTVPAHRAALR